MFYLPNTPFWLRMIFPSGVVWKGDPGNKSVYLTFDDGPEPEVTEYVLEALKQYNIKATFFCIGENVAKHPEIFEAVKKQGHRIGNHTMHHPNGWKTENKAYVSEVFEANKLIGSDLFRPPYGKITPGQARLLSRKEYRLREGGLNPEELNANAFRIIMWSVIAGDFDEKINGDTCYNYIVKYTRPGSIIVFHDSCRAFPRLKIALPKTLEWLAREGFRTDVIR